MQTPKPNSKGQLPEWQASAVSREEIGVEMALQGKLLSEPELDRLWAQRQEPSYVERAILARDAYDLTHPPPKPTAVFKLQPPGQPLPPPRYS
jgi:hypothetical protein